MKTIYRADDGTEFNTAAECEAYEADTVARDKEKRAKKVSEDFRFMALCVAKGNMGMYHLLRDRDLT